MILTCRNITFFVQWVVVVILSYKLITLTVYCFGTQRSAKYFMCIKFCLSSFMLKDILEIVCLQVYTHRSPSLIMDLVNFLLWSIFWSIWLQCKWISFRLNSLLNCVSIFKAISTHCAFDLCFAKQRNFYVENRFWWFMVTDKWMTQ